MRPNRWAPDDTVTTRAPPAARNAGRSARLSWKWPRWFVANCVSYPRASRSGPPDAPALLMRTSRGQSRADQRAAKAATDAGSIRSSWSTATRAIPRSAASARSGSRAPTVTVAPAPERARVTSRPMPACPPVTIMVRPERSRPATTSAAVAVGGKGVPSGCCLWIIVGQARLGKDGWKPACRRPVQRRDDQ